MPEIKFLSGLVNIVTVLLMLIPYQLNISMMILINGLKMEKNGNTMLFTLDPGTAITVKTLPKMLFHHCEAI